MKIIKKVEVVGNKKEISIKGWDSAPADIKNQVKLRLRMRTKEMVIFKSLLDANVVDPDKLNDKYSLTITWIKVPFIGIKGNMKVSASENDLEYIRYYLCGCEECTNNLVEILGGHDE